MCRLILFLNVIDLLIFRSWDVGDDDDNDDAYEAMVMIKVNAYDGSLTSSKSATY